MPPPAQPPTRATSQPSGMGTMVESMAPWERYVVIGALVLLLGDVVFGILLREFYAGDVMWLASAIALVAFYANRQRAGSVPAYASLMLLAAAAVAVIGVRGFLIEAYYVLRNAATISNEMVYLLGFVVWIIGVLLVASGGLMLWRSRSA
jgi:hypothetical protein